MMSSSYRAAAPPIRRLLATSSSGTVAVRAASPFAVHRCISTSLPTMKSSSIPTNEGPSFTSTSGGTTGAVFDKISFIGTGMMAQAILEPLIKRNVQPADQITVYDVNDQMMDNVAGKFGVRTASSLSDLVHGADLVVCAVKPQNLTSSFFKEVRKGKPTEDSILLSIVAGKPMSEFERGGFSKIVRSMPNTPATIGQGMTVWSCSNNVSSVERRKVRDVLQTMGKQLYVDDESFIDMATSISGSGPAYIFMLAEAMIDCAVHMGFARDRATTLVYHTMLGSTLYAMETKQHPAILRNSVTSPSGTTASAIYELESGKFRTVIKDAMWACYRRSLEMGNHDSNVGPGRTPIRQPVVSATGNGDEDEESGDESASRASDKEEPQYRETHHRERVVRR